uniref:FHA domain-containing protein n=1 Tax=Panagrolaimus sp. ES5 TaxID=591445 RepID=A0AC34FBD9_9BILA
MFKLIRPSNAPIKFQLIQSRTCFSRIGFYFYQKNKSKFCHVLLDLENNYIKLEGEASQIIIHSTTRIELIIKKNKFELKANNTGNVITRTKECELDIDNPYNEQSMMADFFLYDSNDCEHKLMLPETSHLATWFINTTKSVTTTTSTTAPPPKTTVTTTKITTGKKVENAEFGIHWYIIILIAEIILCIFIGAFSTWLYDKLTKRFKAQQQSLSVEDSHDEEIETALEDLQQAQSGEVVNHDDKNGLKSLSKNSTGSTLVNSHGPSLQTARHPSNNNQRMLKEKNVQSVGVSNITLPTPHTPNQPQKSKKSFLERMGNKFKRKNKESNSKKFYFQQPQISVSGFSSSTTMNIPFGESKEVVKARDKAKPLQEKKKSVKKIKAQAPFSKEFNIDQQGCEPTQASREESYQADIAEKSQAKKKQFIKTAIISFALFDLRNRRG